MDTTPRKARHRRRRTALIAGVPLALGAAGALAYGTVFGVFGADAQPEASAATTAPAWATATADGFASVNALGQNGTYGGRGGKTVTVRNLADLEKYATASDPYVIVVAAAITMDPVGKEIKVASNTATLVQRGNVFSGTSGRNESGGGTAFDPKTYYSYTPDKAADVPSLVKSGAGPRSSIGATANTASNTASNTTPTTKAAATSLTVAKDGSGQYTSVQRAVDAVPAGNTSRVVIQVKPGTYRETVKVPANKPHVTIEGTGASRKDTVIVYDNAAGTKKPDGSGTYGTPGSATVSVQADDFQARNLTISNDFDEARHQDIAGQAVALLTAADKIVLEGVIVTGDQDTLEMETAAANKPGRVYVTNSYIVGNVDFVFGRATAVIDKSVITLKKRWNGTSAGFVTAPGTPANRKGILINRTTISGDVAARSFFLGRNWHAGGDASLRPQTTVRNSTLSAAIKSTPWSDMGGFSWKKDRFAEYRNTGPGAGAASSDRPQLTDAQAADQEVADWLGGWNPAA
ncbi:pectinesterase family protein [Streptomyces sp. NPDC001795]|uniref:pectinesterase family protein n=1 Tax=Streptomyces sp. NPDC001795 TaxID=3154525 RepID=UPI00331CE5F0